MNGMLLNSSSFINLKDAIDYAERMPGILYVRDTVTREKVFNREDSE